MPPPKCSNRGTVPHIGTGRRRPRALLQFEPARAADEVRGLVFRREEAPMLYVLVERLPSVGKHLEVCLAEESKNEETGRRGLDAFHDEGWFENLVEQPISPARARRLRIELISGSNEREVPTHDPPSALDVEGIVADVRLLSLPHRPLVRLPKWNIAMSTARPHLHNGCASSTERMVAGSGPMPRSIQEHRLAVDVTDLGPVLVHVVEGIHVGALHALPDDLERHVDVAPVP